ncbi:MAG: TMEM175 family protein [Desulfovibrionaceae bacterium]|nr:TMEM175 family protein [Desulfovibrionaceae bacterium]
MAKSRLEAFTDGVIAIIITILVLTLTPPAKADLSALLGLSHIFLVYVVSFLTLAVYWNNHHHMFQAVKVVTGKILWLNILFLFCISLFPFTTEWLGANLLSRTAQMTYGALMLAADIVWVFLAHELVRAHSKESTLAKSLKGSKKSAFTIGSILCGLAAGWFWPPAVMIGCLASLLPWIVPDKRIEALMRTGQDESLKSSML